MLLTPSIEMTYPTPVVAYPQHEDDIGLVDQFLKASPEDQRLMIETFKVLSSSFGLAGYMDMKHTFKALQHGLKSCLNIKAGISQHLNKVASSDGQPEDITRALSKIVGYIADPLCFLKSVVYLVNKPSSLSREIVKSLDASFDALCSTKKPLAMSVNYLEISGIYREALKHKLSIAKNTAAMVEIACTLAGYPATSLAFGIASYGCSVVEYFNAKKSKLK